MTSNLNKYLHEVFRKEVKDLLPSNSKSKKLQYQSNLDDRRKNHFVLDNKYSLRLDEII